MSVVLSFHTITSRTRQTCVSASIYSSVVHFSVQHGNNWAWQGDEASTRAFETDSAGNDDITWKFHE